MSLLVAGLVIFLGMHSTMIFAPGFRDSVRARLGPGAWRGVYSIVSLAGLVLIIKGFALASLAPIVLYTPPAWAR